MAVGPFVTLVFENRDTVRFQIQEVARVERILFDEAIQAELEAYNPLIPDPGTLSATLFVELTSEADLRTWLPKLVGIERSLALVLPDGTSVPCAVDEQHARRLSGAEATTSVHFVRFEPSPAQAAAFGPGAVVAASHPNYSYAAELGEATVAELRRDLAGS